MANQLPYDASAAAQIASSKHTQALMRQCTLPSHSHPYHQAQHQTNSPMLQTLRFDAITSASHNESQCARHPDAEFYVFVDGEPTHFDDFLAYNSETVAVQRIKRLDLRISCNNLNVDIDNNIFQDVLDKWLKVLESFRIAQWSNGNTLDSLHVCWDYPRTSSTGSLGIALGRLAVNGLVVMTGTWPDQIMNRLGHSWQKVWGDRYCPRLDGIQDSNVGVRRPGKVILLTQATAGDSMAEGLEG